MLYFQTVFKDKFIMKTKSISRIKTACYITNVCMSMVIIMPALLFIPFREEYGITYTMLGLLTVVNFTTQLLVDLVFSFYSNKFNIEKSVKSIPIIAFVGFLVYAGFPLLFPDFAYVGLVIGTIVFSGASGLAEVLVSPVIAALPCDNPDREMSKLHSAYAWGVVFVTIFSTVILQLVGSENWFVLVFIMTLVPITAAGLFFGVKLPKMQTHEKASGILKLFKNKSMLFCFFAIFFGGASENIISQWSSSYLDKVLLLPKVWGDMLGVAFFAAMLGIGRSLYASKGKNILKTMFIGAIGASVCYLIVIFVDFPALTIVSCAVIGYFVAMLWPGSLILVQDKFPTAGVAIFALMAAGGDLGSSLGPQLMGVVTDIAIENEFIVAFGSSLGYTAEQIGMKFGMAVATLFPISCAILLGFGYLRKKKV